ncbi:hypothetical protein D3C86_1843110 [compost metagenome]
MAIEDGSERLSDKFLLLMSKAKQVTETQMLEARQMAKGLVSEEDSAYPLVVVGILQAIAVNTQALVHRVK